MADITKLNINGTDYNIKDEIVRGLVTTLQNEGYIKASDIIDVLTSTNANVPLSANQGRELNVTKIDNITISGNILRFTANGNTIGSIELPTLTTNQSTQLNTAYNHSQSTHAPSNAEANVQSDWNVTDTNSDAYIANKPTKVSVFTNDAKYVNETYVDNAIENISASNIPIKDIADNFTATNLEGALAELFQFVSNGKTLIARAITDKGIPTSNTDTFQTMATNIGQIVVGGSTETYTVTYNLSNVTSSNADTTANKGNSYTTTLTVDDGYKLKLLIITVDGIDVTEKYYSNSTFTINNVFGNIVITATAVNISDTDANLVTTTRYATQGSVVLVSDRTYKITNTSVWDKLGLCGDITEVPAGNYNVCIKVMEKNVAPDTIATLTLETTFAMTHETTLEADLKTYDLDTVYKKPITVYNHNKIGNEALLAFIQFNASNTGENITVKLWLEKDIVESEPEIPTSYTVTPQLTHCTCSNTATSITPNSSYSTTIRANSGYELSSITVTMGGTNITSSAVSGNTISISNVTGNIVITANATAIVVVEPIRLNLASTMTCTKDVAFNITYSTNIEAVKHEISWDGGTTYSEIEVTSDGTNYTYTHEAINDTTWNPITRWIRVTDVNGNASADCISITIDEPTVSNPIELTLASSMSCNKGETFNITYSTNIEATKHELSMNGGYSYFQIYPTSNGTSYTYSHEAINDTTWNPVSRTIRVTDANGNTATGTIIVTIVESEPETPTSYTITPQLTHCTCSNITTSITPNSSYSTTIRANSGYTLNSITVTMGGTNITSSAVSGNAVSISKVTGNIVITTTVADYSSSTTTTVTLNLTNCISTNIATTTLMGEGYTTTIIAKDGYTLGAITVTLGGEDVSSAVVKEGGTISIGFVRGAIVITASATGGSTTDLTTTILNMQYASAHEVLPNAPIDDVWKDKPRQGKGSTIPTQSCTECASGTHTATEPYAGGNLWSTFGQWGTIFKIKDTNLVQNVGVEITDFKMWRYNTSTNQWVLVNDTFNYGAFYYETFWDDGSAPLNDHKILSSDKKTYKCLMDSATAGRCFHPFSTQKKWADYGFTSNPSYIVSQMKARLIVWDENGADNRASANLCMNVGGDYWIRQGASFDNQWRHNGDIAIGYYKKITSDWQYVYMTTCPQNWDKGFPCDSAVR